MKVIFALSSINVRDAVLRIPFGLLEQIFRRNVCNLLLMESFKTSAFWVYKNYIKMHTKGWGCRISIRDMPFYEP
jgi:hypothetical protein